MITEKLIKKRKRILAANLIVGGILLAAGILFPLLRINIIANHKAIIGLSFIPFAIAFSTWLNIHFIRKYPKEMNAVIIAENDERLSALKDQADASTFRILRWFIFLLFLGYTFAVPGDVFESVGWWITAALLFLTFTLQAVMHRQAHKQLPVSDEE